MIKEKIKPHHLEKKAYVYLRQSTMQQVMFNQESTERQYALREKALNNGWNEDNIVVLDRDLGLSGKKSDNREDFKNLVNAVSMREAGAIFVLEASRLSRSCRDWYRLLEICAF